MIKLKIPEPRDAGKRKQFRYRLVERTFEKLFGIWWMRTRKNRWIPTILQSLIYQDIEDEYCKKKCILAPKMCSEFPCEAAHDFSLGHGEKLEDCLDRALASGIITEDPRPIPTEDSPTGKALQKSFEELEADWAYWENQEPDSTGD
jgi:hypothetical protein